MEGLQEPVEILYDSMGVPHIFASSEEEGIARAVSRALWVKRS